MITTLSPEGTAMGRLLWCLGDRGLKTLFCFAGASFVSSPAGADLLSLSCQRKSAKKGAPDAANRSLNFHNRAEKGKTRFAQTVPLLFSARLQKFKAPHRAGHGHAICCFRFAP
jgi:hypothetical protein